MPLPHRWLSSLLVRVNGELTLFDCGEGTQIAWRLAGWSFRRLAAICISHTHADHIAGLPGLLHAAANSGRIEPVAIFGPPGAREAVQGLRVVAPVLPYDLTVTELGGGDHFALPGELEGSCVEGVHGLPVLAYRADLPRARAFLPGRAQALDIPVRLWRSLQAGESVSWHGRTIAPEEVLGPPRQGLSIAYVTDTRPAATLVSLVAGADLLVCEGTYGSDEDQYKAVRHGHMTFREAATLAQDAGAKRLWLTHFSPALENPESFVMNAASVFPATTLGRAGLEIGLRFPDP